MLTMAKRLAKKGIVRKNRVMEMQPPSEEEFIGSALQPQPDAPRPKTTPYTTSPVALRIGPKQTRYYVPQSLLQNPQWIAFDNSWNQGIHLPDVDEGTGHVLIHYLYTGAYQTLDDMEPSLAEGVRVEFKRAVLAYIAAKKYMLHGLTQLAGQQISCFGAEMNIFDVVEAVNEDFSSVPDDASWFHQYMYDKARTAFEQDHTVFAKDDLFGRIDNVALIRVLAKCMVEVYSNKVSDVLSKKEGPTLEIPEKSVVEAEDLLSEEPPQVECVNIDEAPTEECPAEVFTIEEVPIKEAPAQEAFVDVSGPIENKIDMTFGNTGEIKPSNPNLGDWSSAWGTQQFTWSLGTGEARPTKKDDSNFGFDAFVQASSETGAMSVDDVWGFNPRKKSKKKGKKGSAVPMEEAIPEPDSKPVQLVEDPWSFTFGIATKQKKMKESRTSIEEPPAEPEPTPEPVPGAEPGVMREDDAWAAWGITSSTKNKKNIKGKKYSMDKIEEELKVGDSPPLPVEHPVRVEDECTGGIKKKKGIKGKVEPVIEKAPLPPPPEPVPEQEPEVEQPPVDLFAGLNKSQKKKLQEKLKQEAERKEVEQQQAATAAATEDEPQLEEKVDEVRDGLGSTIVSRKMKNGRNIEGSSEIENPPLAIQKPGAELAEQNKNDNEQAPTMPPAISKPGSELEPERNEGDGWGFRPIWDGSKKKKKSKNTSIPAPPPNPTPPIEKHDPYDPASTIPTAMATKSTQVEENSKTQSNEVDPHLSNGLDPEQPNETDSGYCPCRTKHLATGDRWKTCKQCRVFLREVAVELVRTSIPDETGYEFVDRVSK